MPKVVANVQYICSSRAPCQNARLHSAKTRNFLAKGSPSSGQEVSEPDRLNRCSLIFPACLLASSLASPASATPSAPCTPARAGKHVAEQPEVWRNAVQALLESTASPDQPWGCVGGEVDLVVNGSSGTLTVIDARGATVSRDVATPDDVSPMGEALLAKPIANLDPATPPPPNPVQNPPPSDPKVAPDRGPRLLIAATGGPRYGGPRHLMWGSFGVAVNVPFRPWGGGVWLRFDGFSTPLDEPVAPTREVNVGAAAYWSTTLGRIEIQSLVKPSLVGITRRLTFNNAPTLPGQPQPQIPFVRDETNLDFRLGAEARFAMAFTKRLRGVLSLDAEVSPDQLATKTDPHHPGEFGGRLPAYTAGLGLGVEVAVP